MRCARLHTKGLPSHNWLLRVCLAGLLVCLPLSALAQNYRFSVSRMDLQVYVQPDASARLEYEIDFLNSPAGHPIDVVDIGLPHRNYQISNMSAAIDGVGLTDIRKSKYIGVGVEVHLGSRAIPPGGQGTFTFSCTLPDMVYQDTTDGEYASLQIIPTWFDPQSQFGQTKLQVAIHLLPDVDWETIKYQNEQFKYTDLVLFGDDEEKYPVAIWQYESLELSSGNPKLAVSFPKDGMERVVTMTTWGLFMKWFRENPEAQGISVLGFLILFGIAFFRFSHGTGFILFVMLAAFFGFVAMASPELNLAFWPGSLSLLCLNESFLARRREKWSYLPAMATVEGGGIKRGLTAPQAAILLELPLGKVLSLVIFGLLKKGVLEKVKDDPLVVRVLPHYAVPRQNRLVNAGTHGVILHDYEHGFIDRLIGHEGPVKNCDFNESMGTLIKSVTDRMAGFDLQQTQEYYRAIIQRAWKEAESIGEIQRRDEVVDRNFEWMLMDEQWTDVFERWNRRGYSYRPRWDRPPARSSGPVIPGGVAGGGASELPVPQTARTSLGEVAGSFVGWTENTMGGFASAIEPIKMGLDAPRGGILDLSSVDRVTGEVFQALAESSSRGGGGGGGGGCACACAGCACACACAGGGR